MSALVGLVEVVVMFAVVAVIAWAVAAVVTR